MGFFIAPFSSLVKVFPNERPKEAEISEVSVLQKERFSIQFVFLCPSARRISFCVESPLKHVLQGYRVECVPVFHPIPEDLPIDQDVLRTQPGLYPDLLRPCGLSGSFDAYAGWNSLWIEMEGAVPPGTYPIRCRISDGTEEGRTRFSLIVLPETLPEQTLLHTEWFHADCIASLHQTEVFSETHWALMEQYLRNAAAYGMNMLYTPILTPALDTAVGGERPTVQLIEITRQGTGYRFQFDRLERYLRMAIRCGIRCFEMAHLFSQWGAAFAPKVVMRIEDGSIRRVFGWDTAADSPEYRMFLKQMLPALKAFLRQNGWLDRCYFHLSDEPSMEHLGSYRRARESVAELLEDCRVIDALSDYAFYEQGLVPHPIPATNHAAPFLEHKVSPLWVYYCVGQGVGVCNRFVCMPSYRNRALGWQLFCNRVSGFLHWGFNFWYSPGARTVWNPLMPDADAEHFFPAGDAYLVYPGKDGPLRSLREVVLAEALQDLRAAQKLAQLTSREEAECFIRQQGGCDFAFDTYPKDEAALLRLREAVNRRILEVR